MAKLKTGRHTGAIKAHRQSERRAEQNRGVRKQIRTVSKELVSAVTLKDKDNAGKILNKAASVWDKAAKKGVIHWKTAARKKSRLSKLVNSVSKAK